MSGCQHYVLLQNSYAITCGESVVRDEMCARHVDCPDCKEDRSLEDHLVGRRHPFPLASLTTEGIVNALAGRIRAHRHAMQKSLEAKDDDAFDVAAVSNHEAMGIARQFGLFELVEAKVDEREHQEQA